MKCVARVANKLSISEKTKHQALNIMEEVINKNIIAGRADGLSGNSAIRLVDKN